MNITVFGGGAIGGHLAARLGKGGADVSVVARGANLEAMRRAGVRVHAKDGTFTVPVRASSDPAELGAQDAVIVAVKAPSLPSVAAAIGPLLGKDTPVVFAMNGIPWFYFHKEGGPHDGMEILALDPDGALRAAIGPERAIAGVVYSACTVVEPGVIEVENPKSRLILGEPDGSKSARAEALAAVLSDGGIETTVAERVRDAIWAKLFLNLGTGFHAVLTGAPPSRFLAEEACRTATRQVLGEAASIAAALGCKAAPDADGQLRNAAKSHHKPSILQDLELGRPMEIDALHSVPLLLARMHGVDTPTLDMLAAMVRTRAREAGLYAGEAGAA